MPKGDQWRRGQRIAKLVGNTRYQAIIDRMGFPKPGKLGRRDIWPAL